MHPVHPLDTLLKSIDIFHLKLTAILLLLETWRKAGVQHRNSEQETAAINKALSALLVSEIKQRS